MPETLDEQGVDEAAAYRIIHDELTLGMYTR